MMKVRFQLEDILKFYFPQKLSEVLLKYSQYTLHLTSPYSPSWLACGIIKFE